MVLSWAGERTPLLSFEIQEATAVEVITDRYHSLASRGEASLRSQPCSSRAANCNNCNDCSSSLL
jgi:hypothetical protein